MLRLACLTFLVLYSAGLSAQQVKPEATEDWSYKPPLVMPGKKGRPPSDAIVLFSGQKDLDQWEHPDSSAVKWKAKGRTLTIVPKTKDIRTKRAFGNMQLHIEWKTPDPKEDKGRNDAGNSGVLFMGLYELQIYESYQYATRIYYNGQAGSIYKQYAPRVNACLPPESWQVFDVVFEAPVFNPDQTLKTPACITVFHNGVLILHHVAIKGPMVYAGYPQYTYHANKLPLVLQEHNSRVSFRNIWVREL
ncbi:DUF1080 domain-containing protein [uncultured Chitinophaga sp.]|jgi:Domain of Unknown Function (DUF1080).|uniref:3-keto-disaccharide hydrolase n=1 Tax=uncultured Chitinophaga sp. TaxID=339340 RepID=UPI00262FCC9A|nr:DUF1080 domain-containing protein [uncultured Chitinophaga sp.]